MNDEDMGDNFGDEEEEGSFDMNEMISIDSSNFSRVVDSLQALFPEMDKVFFEQTCLSIMNKEMLFADFISYVEKQVAEEMERNLHLLVDSGDVEMGVKDETGEVVYWLTPQGKETAEQVERLLKKELEDFFGENTDTPEEE